MVTSLTCDAQTYRHSEHPYVLNERHLKACFYFMCIAVLPACISVKVPDILELELPTSCELPCGCWKVKPGPLEEQPVLLTSELSIQPPSCVVF